LDLLEQSVMGFKIQTGEQGNKVKLPKLGREFDFLFANLPQALDNNG
jgi:hypothetical protein